MSGRGLNPGVLPPAERRSRTERHLLALTGGGYRGFFTSTVLRRFEQMTSASIVDCFDLIGGTSIGGILAIGLATGITGSDLAELIREHGPSIFTPRPLSFAGLSAARYQSENLARAVGLILGSAAANRPFRDLPAPLIVCAVDELASRPRLFRTSLAGGTEDASLSVLDVALATSAAPTYFQPHVIEGRSYVDGGLVANAPDALLIGEALRRYGCDSQECHLLSIGTAGSPRIGRVSGAPGKFTWVAKHALVDLIMSAQEQLAIDQACAFRPATYLRVDATPAQPIRLDAVDSHTTERLIALADEAVETAKKTRGSDLKRFLAHRAYR